MKFSLSISSELVDSHDIGFVFLGVVLFDRFEIAHEDSESVLILFRCDLEKLGVVLFPLLVELSGCGLSSRREESDGGNAGNGREDSNFECLHKDILK